MRITQTKELPGGSVRLTLELAPGEVLVAVRHDANYQLAPPLDDVVYGSTIANAQRVAWDAVEQTWRPV